MFSVLQAYSSTLKFMTNFLIVGAFLPPKLTVFPWGEKKKAQKQKAVPGNVVLSDKFLIFPCYCLQFNSIFTLTSN